MRVLLFLMICCLSALETHGQIVDQKEIDSLGIETFFYQRKIDETILKRIKGKSYPKDCPVPIDELRYLNVLHYNAEEEIKVGELICHQSISDDLLIIFRKLYDHKYPIERMVLIDEFGADDEASMAANNSSAFNFRYVSGTTRLSKHAKGLAVDVNPRYNPYVRRRNGKTKVEPAGSEKYADRTQKFDYKIEKYDLCCRLFKQYGFRWGGDWKNSKDYQHFEK